jgi:aminocarboxymuconate-semialdehyde decarboxylase
VSPAVMSPVVDVHAHLAVPAADALVADEPGFAAELAEERLGHSPESMAVNRAQLERAGPLMTDVTRRLAAMDAMGVDIQVVQPMPMHHYWAEPPLAAALTRTVNEAIAAHCALAPGRLAGLGTVPLQHPDLAVASLVHAVTGLGLAGVCAGSHVPGPGRDGPGPVDTGPSRTDRELADPAHEPFWTAAEELGAVVLIHPWGCRLGGVLAGHYLGNTVGQPAETTVALSHIIFSGLLDRHPGLRLVAVHGGGYLPSYLGRSDHAWQVRPDARGCAEPPGSYLRRIWFDSLVYTAAGLSQLVAVAGPDRVMLGTDYPFDMGVDDPVQRLDAAGFSPADRDKIAGRTAAALFGLGGADGRA